jgi:riboflavin-specific deaminase-like protein
VVSGSGSLSPTAELWAADFSPVIVLSTKKASETRLKRLRRLASEVWVSRSREVDFATALQALHDDHGVGRLVCEGGAQVNDALFRAGLVDELHLTVCPLIFGGRTAPTISDGTGFQRLADAAQLELKSLKRVGDELFLVYRSAGPKP